jgi:aminotransferase EvaB
VKVPFNDLKRQYVALADAIDSVLHQVASSGWYVMGPEHDSFEREFARYCGRRHAIAVANGTDALELALRCLDCGPGDEVITVANAGGYATTAIILVGATPVFVDIDRSSLTMSPRSLADAVGERTKAVVVTHLFGQMADVTGIRNVLAGRSVFLIEDCAQAHGAVLDGRRAGSLGDVAAFSFYPTKNLGALGDGGAVITDNDELAARLRSLRQYGWAERYDARMPRGRNSRMDELQAAILRVKLPRLDHWNERRRAIVLQYRKACQGTPLEVVHAVAPSYVAHLCVALHPQRDQFRERLRRRGIDTAVHYPRLDPAQSALKGLAWRAVKLDTSEAVVTRIMSLPCFPELTPEEVAYVCESLKVCA